MAIFHPDSSIQDNENPRPCLNLLHTVDVAARMPSAGPGLEKVVSAHPIAPLVPALEMWNHPSVNRNRYFATVFGLIVMGLNDACLGALIPYVRSRPSFYLPVPVFVSEHIHIFAGTVLEHNSTSPSRVC